MADSIEHDDMGDPDRPKTESAAARTLMSQTVMSSLLQQLAAFAVSVLVLVGILAVLGYQATEILGALWDGALGSPRAIERSFNQAAPLVLTSSAVWLAYQTGLFNIGADGQLQVGGLAAIAAVTLLSDGLAAPFIVIAGLAAATIAGAVWAAVAAGLRVFRGANEVVATIMLNFIAFRLVDGMMSGPLRSSTARFTPQSERIPESAELHSILGTPITIALLIALVVAGATIVAVNGTTLGLRLRGIGRNAEAAAHAAIPVSRYRFVVFSLSGALCGLAGGVVIFGLRFVLAPGWALSWGFSGILIAFLGMRSPILIPLWSVVFGMLASAGPELKAAASVPDAIVLVMQTLPVIALFLIASLTRRRRSRAASVKGVGHHV